MATVWVSTFEYGGNPFRVGVVLVFGLPRVGADANRWALRRNTVGVGGMAIERDERDIRDERVTDVNGTYQSDSDGDRNEMKTYGNVGDGMCG